MGITESALLPLSVAPPGFCNRGEVRYGSIGGLEYEVPQSRLYCLCINVALCSTALQCICRVIRRSSVTMKAHTYYIIFGRPPIGGKLLPFPPWRHHCPLLLGSNGDKLGDDTAGMRAKFTVIPWQRGHLLRQYRGADVISDDTFQRIQTCTGL